MQKFKLDKIGSDPEIFLVNENGMGVPSEHYFKGDKDNPENLGNGFQLLCDNVMVEFNTPPVESKEDFIKVHLQGISFIKDRLPDNVDIDIVASKDFELSMLKSKLARKFGCMPDFDIWTEYPNKSPSSKRNWRSAAGHIHISYDNPSVVKSLFLSKLCDYFLGVPSTILDEDTRRKELYGKAGAVRLKKFGFEYRVLSNFWLKSEENMSLVYDQIQSVFKFANDNPEFEFEDSEEVIDIINTYNKEKALNFINKYEEYMVLPSEVKNKVNG